MPRRPSIARAFWPTGSTLMQILWRVKAIQCIGLSLGESCVKRGEGTPSRTGRARRCLRAEKVRARLHALTVNAPKWSFNVDPRMLFRVRNADVFQIALGSRWAPRDVRLIGQDCSFRRELCLGKRGDSLAAR